MKYEPARHLVHAGDYIVGINRRAVECKKDLMQKNWRFEAGEVDVKTAVRKGAGGLKWMLYKEMCGIGS